MALRAGECQIAAGQWPAARSQLSRAGRQVSSAFGFARFRAHWEAFVAVRFVRWPLTAVLRSLPQGGHDFSGGARDGADDCSETGNENDNDEVVSLRSPAKQSEGECCPQRCCKQGTAENSGN
jgi:hypothetical protein